MARFANGSNVLYLEPPTFDAALPELVVARRAGLLRTATMRLPPELEARGRERETAAVAQRLVRAYLARPKAKVIWVTAPELFGLVEGLGVHADVLVYQRTGQGADDADLLAGADLVLDSLERVDDPRALELPRRGARARTWDDAWRTVADRLDRLVAVDRQAAA